MTAVTHAHNFGICRQRPAVHCTRTYDDGKIAIRSCNTIFMYAIIANKMLLDNNFYYESVSLREDYLFAFLVLLLQLECLYFKAKLAEIV
ncbi:hypothetical protein T01_7663 [Trichinella spiralis]|uniref:Uncharacterized protein n=1 Tax=Trichinella spiralis TaxID=6334 RepID=A0A0V1BJJ8_TRISP|nr:hypothetical protein T01_7663 [Trichinella spiralis]